MSGVEKPNNIRTVLHEILRPITSRMAVATSGGIDSASIVMAAKDLGKKPKGDSVQIYKRLLSYGKYYLGAFAIAMLANILYSAVDSLFAYLLKPILNKGFVSPDPVFLKYIPITIILLFVFLRVIE